MPGKKDSFFENEPTIKRRGDPQNVEESKETPPQKAMTVPQFSKEDIAEASKLMNSGGKAKINYESAGRFSIPEYLLFSDYTVKHISDITLSREDDIIENLLVVLNELAEHPSTPNVDVGDMTVEEFLETLVGMKMFFNTAKHKHVWMCSCQNDVPEGQQKLSEMEIDLKSLQYKSIEESEREMRANYLELFKTFTDEEWKQYIVNRYEEPLQITREEEVAKIFISEPIIVNADNGNFYSFRLPRIRDVVIGYKLACKKFDGKIRLIKSRQEHGVPLAELQAKKEEEIKIVQHEKMKAAIMYAQSMTLLSENETLLSDDEKVEKYGALSRQVLMDLTQFTEAIQFGIYHEMDVTCNHCGKTERGWLQSKLNPIELLPIDDTRPNTERKLGRSTAVNVYFGVQVQTTK